MANTPAPEPTSFWDSPHLIIGIVAAAWFTIGLALGYYFAHYV